MTACGGALSTAGLAASTTDSDQNGLSVVIKFTGNQTCVVNTNINHTVKDLKELVAREMNISPRNLNFVLAGQLLSDDTNLEDCGLGSHTTLHAFCWSDDGLGVGDLAAKQMTPVGQEMHVQTRDRQQRSEGTDSSEVGESIKDVDNTQTNHTGESDVDGDWCTRARGASRAADEGRPRLCQRMTGQNEYNRFFVFCKLCSCVRPAKLRLCCLECRSGAFLLDQGPSSWDDISAQSTIRGTCRSGNCKCSTPKFYLRCSHSHAGEVEVEGTAVVLKHVQANWRRVECIICADVMSPVLIFPCSPGHVTCLECFRQYGSSCLSERRFVEHPQHGYTLPCPAGCSDSHIEESHHFLLMGSDKYERYKNFGAEEYVLQNGGVLCPGQGCGMGLFPEEVERLVRCEECQYESCKECRQAYHRGPCLDFTESLQLNLADLAISEERAERARWEHESLSLIEETTKACPGCHTKTERSGGCMHMSCSRCGQEWCWVCVKTWTRDCQMDHWFD